VQERAASPALVYAELVLDEDVEGLMVFLCEKLRSLGREGARRDNGRYVISRPASILAGDRILTHVEDMPFVLHHLQSTPFFLVRLSIARAEELRPCQPRFGHILVTYGPRMPPDYGDNARIVNPRVLRAS